MTETTTEDNVWYLARDGKQHGPLTHLEMTKLVELGHLRPTDLVWRPGFTDWRPAPTIFTSPQPAVAAASPSPVAATQSPRAAAASMPEPVLAPKPEPSTSAPAPTSQQPSFAALSAKVEAAKSEPASPEPFRFEFPRSDRARPESAPAEPVRPDPASEPFQRKSEPRLGEAREPQPIAFDTRGLRPTGTASQFGTAPAASDPVYEPEPFHLDPPYEEPAPVRKGRGTGVALSLLLAIGGLTAGGYVYRDAIKTSLQGIGTASVNLPVVAAPSGGSGAAPPAAPEAATPVVAAVEPQPTPKPAAPITAVDAGWEASPFWSLAKSEFPQWYAERVRETGEMKAASQPDADIDRKLAEQIVVLRRQNASKALAASPTRLKEIAETFIANLTAMQSQSVDACYEFIGKGELTPAAAALVQKPVEGAPLHNQLRAVFVAVVEGQQNPITRSSPLTTDYNLLAAELGTIGWSQADIQLFADPKALSAAPRDRVCKMVKDWFTAHLAVKDDAARERLLFETLRLVIAG